MRFLRDKELFKKWDDRSVDIVVAAFYIVPLLAYLLHLHVYLAVWYFAVAVPSSAGYCAAYVISWVLFRKKKVFSRIKFASVFLIFNLVVSYWTPVAAKALSLKVFLGMTFAGFLYCWGVDRGKKNGGDRQFQ